MTRPGIPHVERRGRLAAIRFDNPPVNALDNAVRAALIEHIDTLLADPAIDGVLFAAAGSTFVAGADLRELQGETRPLFIGDALRRIERSPKPFVAAMRGPAMGGGLEIALACNARIAGPVARFALPELRLALIPGAGGTQRLPRLIGVSAALDMMLSGRVVTADEAIEIGLIDEVVADAEVEARGWEVLADPPSRRAAPDIDRASLTAAAEQVAGNPVRASLIEAVTAASGPDPDAGYALERARFLSCLATPEAQRRIGDALTRRIAKPD